MFRDLAGDPVTFPNRYLRALTPQTSEEISSQDCENLPVGEKTPSGPAFQSENPVCKKVKLELNGEVDKEDAAVAGDHSRVRRNLFPDEEITADGSPKDNDGSQKSGSSSPIDIQPETCDSDNSGRRADTLMIDGTESDGISNGRLNVFNGPITLTGSARPVRRIIGVPTKRPSYKLVDLHQRIIGSEPPESHRAEDDCLTLARIFWLTPNAPLWADINAVAFHRFEPLYSVRRRKPLPCGVFPSSS
jgi:hypothetical protein